MATLQPTLGDLNLPHLGGGAIHRGFDLVLVLLLLRHVRRSWWAFAAKASILAPVVERIF